MPDNSFDVVSIVDMPETLNAVQQASKEILTRFDLKNSKSEIELNEKDKKIVVTSVDEFKLLDLFDLRQPIGNCEDDRVRCEVGALIFTQDRPLVHVRSTTGPASPWDRWAPER